MTLFSKILASVPSRHSFSMAKNHMAYFLDFGFLFWSPPTFLHILVRPVTPETRPLYAWSFHLCAIHIYFSLQGWVTELASTVCDECRKCFPAGSVAGISYSSWGTGTNHQIASLSYKMFLNYCLIGSPLKPRLDMEGYTIIFSTCSYKKFQNMPRSFVHENENLLVEQ